MAGGDAGFPSPFAYSRGPGYIKTSYIYDPLVWKKANGEVIPWLAESFTRSDDALTYTFQLRPDVRWQDGQPLTAEDVAFTYRYFREQTISPEVIIQPLPDIKEVRATGPRTVEFNLSAPLAPFFGFGGVGSVPIVPKHIWSSIDGAATETDPAVLLGTGPYKLESYSPGEGAYLYTANDDFFLRKPAVRRTGVQAGGRRAVRPAGQRAGHRRRFGAQERAGAVPGPDYRVIDAPPGQPRQRAVLEPGQGRRAGRCAVPAGVRGAINRTNMVQRLYGGNGSTGNPGWIPPANPFHVDVEQYPYDPALAEQLLDRAGYRRQAGDSVRTGPDGEPLRFTMLITSSAATIADLVVSDLQKVGIEVTPQALDRPTFNRRVINGQSQLSIIGFGGMNTDHAPGYLLQVYPSYTETTQHAQGYKNPKVDRLCREQLHEVNLERQMALVAKIQHLIADDLPILPLAYARSYTVIRKNAFDAWYYTDGGVASTVPTIENKLAFVTGKKSTPDIEPLEGAP